MVKIITCPIAFIKFKINFGINVMIFKMVTGWLLGCSRADASSKRDCSVFKSWILEGAKDLPKNQIF